MRLLLLEKTLPVNVRSKMLNTEKQLSRATEMCLECLDPFCSSLELLLHRHPTVKRTPLPLARVLLFLWVP